MGGIKLKTFHATVLLKRFRQNLHDAPHPKILRLCSGTAPYCLVAGMKTIKKCSCSSNVDRITHTLSHITVL